MTKTMQMFTVYGVYCEDERGVVGLAALFVREQDAKADRDRRVRDGDQPGTVRPVPVLAPAGTRMVLPDDDVS